MPNSYISQITLPNGTTYNIKDTEARASISSLDSTISSITSIGAFVIAWNGQTDPRDDPQVNTSTLIPYDMTVEWTPQGETTSVTISGRKPATATDLKKIFLVYQSGIDGDIYDEYVVVDNGSGAGANQYTWERLGSTHLAPTRLQLTTRHLNQQNIHDVTGTPTNISISTSTPLPESISLADERWIKGWVVDNENLCFGSATITVQDVTLNTVTVATGTVSSDGTGAEVVTDVIQTQIQS